MYNNIKVLYNSICDSHVICNNYIVHIGLVCLAIILLDNNSKYPINFISTTFGKLISILIIYTLSVLFSPFTGALLAIVFIFFAAEYNEQIFKDTNEQTNNNDDVIKNNIYVDFEGNAISLDEIKNRYPNLNFDNDNDNDN
tara:strand:- start:62 stop:484 length:423 start_codon:yes stop_codon:yes gene_type:complete